MVSQGRGGEAAVVPGRRAGDPLGEHGGACGDRAAGGGAQAGVVVGDGVFCRGDGRFESRFVGGGGKRKDCGWGQLES